MTPPSDGGPAFPRVVESAHPSMRDVHQDGMSLRQAYKIAALTGSGWARDIAPGDLAEAGPNWLADICGSIADSMLAEDKRHEAD